MTNSVITGGSGFLGSAMKRHLLEAGHNVKTFDTGDGDSTAVHIKGSILNEDDLMHAFAGADVVFHIAGVLGTTELIAQCSTAVSVNIQGTVNVLEACKKSGVTRIFYPTKPNDWLNSYSISKKAGEEFARMYASEFCMDVRILRWLNAYGPGQKTHPVRKAVPMMILQALAGVDIEVYGNGQQPVDLIYTDDLARNTVGFTFLESQDLVVRDTGNTVRMTVLSMAEMIKALSNSSSPIQFIKMRAGEDSTKPVTLLDSPTAADILGYADSTTSVEMGLQKTIDHYSKIPSNIRNEALEFYYGTSGPITATRFVVQKTDDANIRMC